MRDAMTPPSTRPNLRDDVTTAARVVAPSWPLSSTIAVNPLSGFEDRPFADGLVEAAALFGTKGHLSLREFRAQLRAGRIGIEDLRSALTRWIPDLTDTQTSVLLADLVDGSDEPAPMRAATTVSERFDHQQGTDIRTQLDLAIADWCMQWAVRPEPADLWSSWRADHPPVGADLAHDPVDALTEALEALGVPTEAQRDYLERHLATLPGWAAHLRWRQEHHGDDTMVGFLAVCVTLEAGHLAGLTAYGEDDRRHETTVGTRTDRWAAVAEHLELRVDESVVDAALARLPEADRPLVWLDAYERAVHDPLLASIESSTAPPAGAGPTLAQVVCCIDVRSEGLRRHLEASGPYETFGYAGFFGLPARLEPLTGGAGTDQLPVLLAPSVTLREVPAEGHEAEAARSVEQHRRVAALDDAWKAAKVHPIAPLALAEGAGWVAGGVAALRTGAPGASAWLADRLPHGQSTAAPTEFDRSALDVDTQADIVGAVLCLGVRTRTVPLVVLCGHTAHVDNNPLESGLACGACGGNSGADNARVVAAMANDPAVQRVLWDRGTPINEGTWFVPAVHDTPTDTVELLDLDRVPLSHRDAARRLAADLDRAGRAAALERSSTLPGGSSASHGGRAAERAIRQTRRRSRDWAEPVAELGLAGNMAFVVGPRALTAGLDLGRRVFLHSYDAATDHDGTVLAGILTAPLVVAQWINAQYYFSTTDPELLGAGTKAVHNVLGDVGLLSGAAGDLRRGLPLQSVRAGDRLLHEPVRLMAVVEGSLAYIDAAIAGSEMLCNLVEHGWIHLVARRDESAPWMQRNASGWSPRKVAPSGTYPA